MDGRQNGQQRLLEIFIELLKGRKLTKKELMEKYQKKSSTIQRDMAIIEAELNTETAELYHEKWLFEDNIEADYTEDSLENILDRDEKGSYQLRKIAPHNQLTDDEILTVLQILLASRALNKPEMEKIIHKIFDMAKDKKRVERFISNEQLYYSGVPKIDLLERIHYICDAILENKQLQFEYTKNGETMTFQRTPNAICFADMYFYMLSGSNDAIDDEFLINLNKFRINNMVNPEVISQKEKVPYRDRFEGGKLLGYTGNIAFLGKAITMIIDFNFDPVYVLDRFPESKIIAEKNGIYRIEMHVNDGYGIRMWLLEQAGMVKVIHPKYMRDYLVKKTKEALALNDE